MPHIKWTNDLSVGIQAIDIDHKLLISLINQLQDSIEEGLGDKTIGSVLNALLDYTFYHFGREELMMQVCGFPDLEQHKKIHEKLKENLLDIQNRFLGDHAAIEEKEILDFMNNWLTEHIKGTDAKYAPYMENKEGALEKANTEFTDQMAGDVT
ncbi:MAG: bacteriohemerythrin [Rhodospirillales bacterium]|nr:bacteriohemerythrin [Rhodospirillales bacterium]